MTEVGEMTSKRQLQDSATATLPSPPWTPTDPAMERSSSVVRDPTKIPLPSHSEPEADLETSSSDGETDNTETKAADIALPPSPTSPTSSSAAHPSKHPLEYRRPGLPDKHRSGVGVLPRRVSSTGRTVSGRRVSGALQYALRPHLESGSDSVPQIDTRLKTKSDDNKQNENGTEAERVKARQSAREVSASGSIDLAYYQEMKNQVSEIEPDPDSEDVEGIDREQTNEEEDDDETADRRGREQEGPVWDSSLGFGGALPSTMDDLGQVEEEEEEAWMGYVRQQLNTLFPEFFHPDPLYPSDSHPHSIHDTPDLDPDGGERSLSSIATDDLPTPPFSGTSSLVRSAHNPAPGWRAEGGAGVSGVIAGVPNVRQEIGGLRDEIERLRGVVSDLAEGMRGSQNRNDIAHSRSENQLDHGQRIPDRGRGGITEGGRGCNAIGEKGDENNDGDVIGGEESDAFQKTANLSREIIRLLDSQIMGPRLGTQVDDEVFSEENLVILKEHLLSLSQSQPQPQ